MTCDLLSQADDGRVTPGILGSSLPSGCKQALGQKELKKVNFLGCCVSNLITISL
jgi:hypothetical protein